MTLFFFLSQNSKPSPQYEPKKWTTVVGLLKLLHDFFRFQQLDSDISRHGFLCIYPNWYTLSLLKFEIISLINFGKFSALHLFLLPILSVLSSTCNNYTYVRQFNITSTFFKLNCFISLFSFLSAWVFIIFDLFLSLWSFLLLNSVGVKPI